MLKEFFTAALAAFSAPQAPTSPEQPMLWTEWMAQQEQPSMYLAGAPGATVFRAAGEQDDTGEDELILTYPAGENEQVRVHLTYRNNIAARSSGGRHTLTTDWGPIVVEIDVVAGGPETLEVVEWPQELFPFPLAITVEDGQEADVLFIAPMM